MSAILVDTDVLIEVLRGRNSALLKRWETVAGSGLLLAYSPITAAETWHGVRPAEESSVTALFRAMTCIPIDAEIGQRAGEYLRRYRPSHGIELGDALIAATAAVHQLPLWTRNRKHYPMREVPSY